MTDARMLRRITDEAINRTLHEHGIHTLPGCQNINLPTVLLADTAVEKSRAIADAQGCDWTTDDEQHVYDEVFARGLGRPD